MGIKFWSNCVGQLFLTSVFLIRSFRIWPLLIESLRLEKTTEIISSNHQPITITVLNKPEMASSCKDSYKIHAIAHAWKRKHQSWGKISQVVILEASSAVTLYHVKTTCSLAFEEAQPKVWVSMFNTHNLLSALFPDKSQGFCQAKHGRAV